MKKVILAVTLAMVLIAGGLGGTVLANTPPDDSPKGMWEIITAGISDILTKLDDIKDSTDKILVTEMIEDDLYAGGGYPGYDSDNVGEPDGPIMHVSVTFWKNGVLTYLDDLPTPPTYVEDGSIRITIEPNDAETARQVVILRHDDFHDSQWKAFTYEFNARQWHISCNACWFDAETQPLNVHYVATMSYHPDE
jgi:hypothetical protein